MINGDISNDSPPRIIVTSEVVCDVYSEDTGRFIKKTERKIKFKKEQLSHLWNIQFNYGLVVELAGFAEDGWTQTELDTLMEKLDNRGGNPFAYANLYDDWKELRDDLPYRPNLKGIVDTQGGVARFGSWGVELNNL